MWLCVPGGIAARVASANSALARLMTHNAILPRASPPRWLARIASQVSGQFFSREHSDKSCLAILALNHRGGFVGNK